MANCHGHPIAILLDVNVNSIEPTGLETYEGDTTFVGDISKMLFRYLESNNVVVGWHVGWTLASIGVSLPASRVVNLGTEQSVQ